mmetsp:Transcript_28312/g.39366  ORF Transcript_28312/g.39366 Transcript_28312/m.39366 type:complete len:83 (-) Transcript_28312:2469-2717(-)
MILSEFLTVLSRWAIMIVVLARRWINLSNAACTTASLLLSKAEVASSNRRIAGFCRIARAMATRCFCPPLSLLPPIPTSVSY